MNIVQSTWSDQKHFNSTDITEEEWYKTFKQGRQNPCSRRHRMSGSSERSNFPQLRPRRRNRRARPRRYAPPPRSGYAEQPRWRRLRGSENWRGLARENPLRPRKSERCCWNSLLRLRRCRRSSSSLRQRRMEIDWRRCSCCGRIGSVRCRERGEARGSHGLFGRRFFFLGFSSRPVTCEQ